MFSVGAMLYHCLTGEPPFDPSEGLWPLLNMIVEEEPRPPRALAERIPQDLENVLLKCLEKDPARRYADGAALAEELGRFLAGEAVEARPLDWRERLARRARRNKVLTGVISLAFLLILGLLVAGGLGALYSVQRIREERDTAEHERREAEASRQAEAAQRRAAERAREVAERAQAREQVARRRAQEESAAKDRQLAFALRSQGERLLSDLRGGEAAALFAASLERHPSPAARSGLIRADLSRRLQVAAPWPLRLTDLAASGERVVVGTTQAGSLSLTLRDPSAQTLRHGRWGGSWAVALDHSGELLVEGDLQGSLRLWKLGPSGAERPIALRAKAHPAAVVALTFVGPDRLCSGSLSGGLRLWQIGTKGLEPLGGLELGAGHPRRLAFAAGVLACVLDSGELLRWQLRGEGSPGGPERFSAHQGGCRGLAARSIDGAARFLSAGLDGRLCLWGQRGAPLKELALDDPLSCAALVSDELAACGTTKGRVEVWHLGRGERVAEHHSHGGAVLGVGAESEPDSEELVVVSAGWNGLLVKLFLREDGKGVSTQRLRHRSLAVDLRQEGRSLLSVGEAGEMVELALPAQAGQPIDETPDTVQAREMRLDRVAGDPRRNLRVAAGGGAGVLLVEMAQARIQHERTHKAPVCALSFAKDGRFLSADRAGTVALWKAGAVGHVWVSDHGRRLRHAALDEAGQRRALVDHSGVLRVYEGTNPRPLLEWPECSGQPAWVPAGLLIPRGRELLVWRAGAPEPTRWAEASGAVRALRYRWGGERLLVLRQDGLVALWDLASARPVVRWPCVERPEPDAASLDPAERRVAAVGADGAPRVWEVPAPDPHRLLVLPGGVELTSNLVLYEGNLLAACSDERIRSWDLQSGVSNVRFPTPGIAHELRVTADGWLLAATPTRLLAKRSGQAGFALKARHPIHAFAYRPERQIVYLGLPRGQVRELDLKSRQVGGEWGALGGSSSNSALALRGRLLAAGSGGGHVVVSDLAEVERMRERARSTGEAIQRVSERVRRTYQLGGALLDVRALAFGREGELFVALERRPEGLKDRLPTPSAAVSSSQIWRLELESGRAQLLAEVTGAVSGLTLGPQERFLVAAGANVRLFHLEAGGASLVCQLPSPDLHLGRGAVFLDGDTLVTTWGSRAMRIWDLPALALAATPAELVERAWRQTGYRVLGGRPVLVRHEAEFALLEDLDSAR